MDDTLPGSIEGTAQARGAVGPSILLGAARERQRGMRGKIIAVFAVVVFVVGTLSYALTRVTLGDLSTPGEAQRALASASAQLQLEGLVLERWLGMVPNFAIVARPVHFAAGDEPVVDVNVHGFADLSIELDDGATAKLQELAHLHRGAAEHRRNLDRYVIDGIQLLCVRRHAARFGEAADLAGARGAVGEVDLAVAAHRVLAAQRARAAVAVAAAGVALLALARHEALARGGDDQLAARGGGDARQGAALALEQRRLHHAPPALAEGLGEQHLQPARLERRVGGRVGLDLAPRGALQRLGEQAALEARAGGGETAAGAQAAMRGANLFEKICKILRRILVRSRRSVRQFTASA